MFPVENRTPFAAEVLPLLDRQGREIYVLVIVATFICSEGRAPRLCVPGEPVCLADEYRGDPTSTSIIRDADVCGPKPLVDVIVNGSAYAASAAGSPIAVELRAAEIHKRLCVAREMPVTYENAFGGPDRRDNPVGTDQPSIVYENGPRDRPAGFGVIGRGWMPRIQFAGTYDETWLREQWPLPPKNFDSRHFQCAPLDQQSGTLRGGENIVISNMSADGVWKFRLPGLSVPAHVVRADGVELMRTKLDTVYLWPGERRVVLCHRGVVPRTPESPPRELVLGHLARGWLRARARKVRYLDTAGTDGGILDRVYFS